MKSLRKYRLKKTVDIVIDLMRRIITCFATGYRQLVVGDNGLGLYLSSLWDLRLGAVKPIQQSGFGAASQMSDFAVLPTDRHRPAGLHTVRL